MSKKKSGKDEYWLMRSEDVLDKLDTSKEGLSQDEVRKRQKQFGLNVIKRKKLAVLKIFLRQFKSPLIWILIVVSIISIFFGELINAIIIFSMILLSSLLSFFNEYRSEHIIEDLNKKIAHKVIVMRNGEKQEVSVSEIVQGDIVFLSNGSAVPADMRLIEVNDLEVNEAVLTGESVPVRKINGVLIGKQSNLQNMKNYVFAGTIIVNGEGIGVVVKTGDRTEFGRIAQEALSERQETEFQKGIKDFGGLLLKTILVLVIAIFFINALFKHNILDSLLFALAIAIGLTPELLPMVITVSLSRGAHMMSKKEVVVKRLIAVEDLGNMDVLCTDKTGTLTEGNISLYSHVDVNNKASEEVLLYGLVCNSAVVHGKKFFGNPIDVALWKYANEHLKEKVNDFKKLEDIPFDYERRMMSVVVKKEKKTLLITKGAPQEILQVCKKVNLDGREAAIAQYRDELQEKFVETAKEGVRVIAVAYKEIDENKKFNAKDEKNLVFLGFITFIDPPKKSIREAVDLLEAMSVKLKILTGDNELVTKKIAAEVDIPIKKIVLGEEIDKLSDEQLKQVVEETDAFCRLTPEHKRRIVKALQANGHDVGFMGDGVNDVPALMEADVAISVNDAVDVAKDASDIILLRKNLKVLAEGVAEGRRVFGNTMKYILMGTSSNFGNMFSAAGGSIFLPFLPMLPIQILLANFIYDVSETTIPFDNVDAEYLKKPKRINIKAIRKYMLFFGPISSLYDFLTFFVMLVVFNASMAMFQTGWFIESMMTQILVVFVIRTRKVPFFMSKPGILLTISTLSAVVLVLILPFTKLGKLFGFTTLPWNFFAILILMVVTYLILVELGKAWFFKRYEI